MELASTLLVVDPTVLDSAVIVSRIDADMFFCCTIKSRTLSPDVVGDSVKFPTDFIRI